MLEDYSGHFIASGLDLESVIFKLCHPRGGGWQLEKARRIEDDYRMWLFLHVLFPDKDLVPSEDVDQMWHAHILDTEAYEADCTSMFGQFLNHFPYAGMLGEVDMEIHRGRAAETAKLFRSAFGRELTGLPAECTNCCDDARVSSRRPRVADLASIVA